MALSNLKLVSETVKNLLTNYFTVSEAWSSWGSSPEISPRPPDKLTADAVGFYLYHITEDAQYKNLPAPGSDSPPVRFAPMGLNLYYIMTAHSSIDSAEGTFKEQLMFTIAMKALHDYPVIDDKTVINETKIFPAELQGTDNRFRIVLQPTEPKEAASYWASGNLPQRLSAFYEVSVVLLEPEETKSRASRVLSYGLQSFVGGAPRMESSSNILNFTLPGQSDLREVELRPAQVPPAITPLPDEVPKSHEITFKGSGFEGGQVSLKLKSNRWNEAKEVDASWWCVEVTREGMRAVVRETTTQNGDVLLPGLYAAQAKIQKTLVLPDGSSRIVEHLSNDCPFIVSPRIDSISLVGTDDIATVTGYLFQHEELPKESVWVYIGPNKLERQENADLAPGQFQVADSKTITLCLPDGLEPGKSLPLRIMINGAESPPNWISKPQPI